jgi:hypothetical protein
MRRKVKHHHEMKIVCVHEGGDVAIYIEFNGKRIARRGHPDTPHAKTWISLEPGWTVRDVGNYDGIVVEHHGALVQ